ncbi:hypothetical protein AMTRI_Chr04g247560 [Amborella trichopoda]|uniref:DUF1685 domain-containing protein n=1 Tax=Amborella trichopoda TaxID=13333 RepID=W1NZA0_AMBTC|nr:uncharacterized protein LOC18428710 [Amborella trichopoda]ERN00641.1 hypothetical protein AMTR_s00091p00173550 [Amborella trichopoda]|eukprot:XP_006838072.1 uncharacterized protein LOC18428710 [Amborella trichopoda]
MEGKLRESELSELCRDGTERGKGVLRPEKFRESELSELCRGSKEKGRRFSAGGAGKEMMRRSLGGLYKQRSLSSDYYREEAWLRRKDNSKRRTKSVTDEDLDELRGCIELGFGFGASDDHRLTDTLPALDLYYAVNRQYNDSISKSSASDSSGSPVGCPHNSFFGPGDSPQLMKTRLRQWAQVVACSVRQCC